MWGASWTDLAQRPRKSQQAVAGWFMKRYLGALRSTYNEIQDALGTDAAERWLVFKAEKLRQTVGGAMGI